MPEASLGKIKLHYEEQGQGPPLMMILGLGQDMNTWAFQVPNFSKHFRVIRFDNRDSGRSSRSEEPYTTRTMASDTLGLMDHLGIERAHILGTSMGGMIALEVALQAPDRVMSLILASTTSWGAG